MGTIGRRLKFAIPAVARGDPKAAASTPISDLDASILKQIVPDINALLEKDVLELPSFAELSGRQHLIMTIIELFRRQQQPIVLIFEDLQWFYESWNR